MDSCVITKDLCKSYSSLAVLDHWNLTISKNERLVLLGPSGAGKTTFLKIVAGLEKPSGGRIICDYRRIGFVFQEPRLIPWRTVKENLLFIDKNGNYREILALLKLQEFENYLPARLSAGMRQRVNLARALMTQPDLLILDEAFQSLDLRIRIELMEIIKSRCQEQKTTLIAVTHDIKEAIFMADRIVFLSERPARFLGEIKIPSRMKQNFMAPEFLNLESEIMRIISSQIIAK